MAFFFFTLFLFICSVIAHIFYCRRAASEKLYVKVYGYISFIGLAVYVGGILTLQCWDVHSGSLLLNPPFQLTSGIIFVLLIPSYLIFYILTLFVSPSQKILLSIARHGQLSHADILTCIQEEDFIGTRLNDLCASKCISLKQGRYVLSPSGRKITIILEWIQHVTGRKVGG